MNFSEKPNADSTRASRTRRTLCAIGVIAAVAILWQLATTHPHHNRYIPECPSWSIAGVYCPGCGSLRATHHLVNARPTHALRQNAIFVLIGAPVGAYAFLQLCTIALRARPIAWPKRTSPWIAWTILATILIWAIARNLPAPQLDWTRPTTPSNNNARQAPGPHDNAGDRPMGATSPRTPCPGPHDNAGDRPIGATQRGTPDDPS